MTIRHLLTMTAGFPTDDPWGDRQQGLPLTEFGQLLAGGVRFNWAPGTQFEYSNMGYAILGRVIAAVSGQPYPDYVRHVLLEPAGHDPHRVRGRGVHRARPAGYWARWPGPGLPAGRGRVWSEVAFDVLGAFAPMGGVFSCVQDLARWVAGFAAAFPPGGPRAGQAHPLAPATRREMQLPQVSTGWERAGTFPGNSASAASSNGFGLFVQEHSGFGRIVSHSGGYPGFGSNMRWHPATGTGVIVLGNSTYAAATLLASQLLEAVLNHRERPPAGFSAALAPAGAGPWPETLAAREAVSRLLQAWDDGQAARLFSPNVAQDVPFAERQRAIAAITERIGAFGDDARRPPEFDTPAHCRWWLAGERGVVQAQLQLNPERPPRVQSLTLAVPPAPGSALAATLDALLAWLNGTDRDWPEAVPAAAGIDTGLLGRRLRMAAVWACRLPPGGLPGRRRRRVSRGGTAR